MVIYPNPYMVIWQKKPQFLDMFLLILLILIIKWFTTYWPYILADGKEIHLTYRPAVQVYMMRYVSVSAQRDLWLAHNLNFS